MAAFSTRVCMFCNERFLPGHSHVAENIAFMEHVDSRADCTDAFAAWRSNMQDDFKGD